MRIVKAASIGITLYAIFCLVGGLIGYFRAESLVSLIVGTASCLLLLACARGIYKGKQAHAVVALLVSLALGLRFVYAFSLSPQLMPHLVMIILSSTSAALSMSALHALGKKQRA